MKRTNAVMPMLRMVRVHIVAGGFVAFSLGALLAFVGGGTCNLLTLVLCYAIVFLGDLSTHYSNDYFDVQVDKYAEKKSVFSGSGILIKHPQLRPLARKIAITFLVLSNLLAVLAVVFRVAPLELLIIALAANFLGWAYSAPPLRLISRGLGEFAIAFATGFAIPAVGYLSVRGHLDPLFLCLAVPFMLYGFMLSLSLEAPDIEVDNKGDKRNLAVRKGIHLIFVLIVATALAATGTLFSYAWESPFTAVNFNVVVLFSIAPLAAGFLGFVGFFKKKQVAQFSTVNIASLFLFNILMVIYLLFTALASV
ncbi:MAG: prenyltransferase [Candidatus Bathyarchaeota archaeon]|nr:prenyltransferase [Candidatus Bathyarchaeota archaeon]